MKSFLIPSVLMVAACTSTGAIDPTTLSHAQTGVNIACNVVLPLAQAAFNATTTQVSVSDEDKATAARAAASAQAACDQAKLLLASLTPPTVTP